MLPQQHLDPLHMTKATRLHHLPQMVLTTFTTDHMQTKRPFREKRLSPIL